jgi:hypothetical protein
MALNSSCELGFRRETPPGAYTPMSSFHNSGRVAMKSFIN